VLEEDWIIPIDNLEIRSNIGRPELRSESPIHQGSSNTLRTQVSRGDCLSQNIHPDRIERIQISDGDYTDSAEETDRTTETNIHNKVIENCELFPEQSQKERKASGQKTLQAIRVVKQKAKKPLKAFGTQTDGIDRSELRPRTAAGECQRCVWPQDRQGSYKTIDRFRWKRLENGTAPIPQKKSFHQG
jgi:hypothetical protein